MMDTALPTRVIDLLIHELEQAGVKHVFGIPGDYALGLFDALTQSRLQVINTCDEQGAGFAADAYARIRGLGAVCVTYGVGGLKLVNSTAQAYAERSPVVVISGAPGIAERAGDALLHHRVRGFDTQLRVFEEITAASAVLDDPETAGREVVRVLDVAMRSKRPVYFEIPRDHVYSQIHPVADTQRPDHSVDEATLKEAVTEAVAMLNAAVRPVILAGVEIHRFNLQARFIEFVERVRMPFATTIMGKSVVSEAHPLFFGVYGGGLCREEVRQAVEDSDCPLLLGAMPTDLNTGIFTARLDPGRTISATADLLRIRRHHYPGIDLRSFLDALVVSGLVERRDLPAASPVVWNRFVPEPERQITVARLFECINTFLTEEMVVIADVGDALFGATDLTLHGGTEFIASAYYASLGFAVPASVGVALAAPERRPLVLVGDGAFQMTGIELTTCVRYRLSPIVVVLDNAGYGTERPLLDGPFNDVHPWAITALPDLIGGGQGYVVHDEGGLKDALRSAGADRATLALIHVHLKPGDRSPALTRLAENLKQRV